MSFEDMIKDEMQKRKKPAGTTFDSMSDAEFLNDMENHIKPQKEPAHAEPHKDDVGDLPFYPPEEEKKQSYFDKIKSKQQQQKNWLKDKTSGQKQQQHVPREPEYEQPRQQRPQRQRPQRQMQQRRSARQERSDLKKNPQQQAYSPDYDPYYQSQPPKRRIPLMKPKKKEGWNRYKAITMLVAVSVMFLIFMYSGLPEGDAQKETTFQIMVIMGMLLFFPIGMLAGWGMLDPFMRCRLMRRMTRKNLGVVCFVSRGKRIIAQVRNFDDSLVWVKHKCWAIRKNRIYEIDKYGERISDEDEIDPEDMVTITETVPMIFFDVDSMSPLNLHEDISPEPGVAPDELGSALKGWVDNQQAKLMFLKRTMETYYLIMIIAVIASAFFSYQNNVQIEEIYKMVQGINNRLSSIPPSLIQPFLGLFNL